ncbi:MAG: phenylacetate--CoA ligase family protein [Planctomycetota bacterium]
MGRSHWDNLSPEGQRRLQLARLREFLARQVVPFHPYYRELFARDGIRVEELRSLADLARIPLSRKADVAPTADEPGRPQRFILQPTPETLRATLPWTRKLGLAWAKLTQGVEHVRARLGFEYRPVQVFFTTGRTALPTSFVLSNYDLQILHEVGRRIAEVVDIDAARDRVVSMFPYAPHLAFWQVHAVGVASGTFTLHTGGGKVMGTEGILRAIDKMKPTALCGIPGYTYHMMRAAVEEGIDLSGVRTVFLGGDRIVDGFREKLADLLRQGGARDPRILSVFGFTESRRCWAECPGGEGTGLHGYPDLDLFEVIDPKSGEILPEGETGELVYTPLDGRGSVVLRYRTGDIVNGGITREPCPACGRCVPRIASNLSRSSNLTDFSLTKLKGALVNLNLFADVLNSHPAVDEWQLVIGKRNDDPFEVDELTLYLSLAPGRNPDAAVKDVGDQIQRALEVRPNRTEVLSREEVLERIGMETRLKENRIVDLRERSEEAATMPAAGRAPAGTREGSA